MSAMSTTTKSVGELNREWFDSVAASIFKEDWVRDLAKQISSFLQDNVEWIGQEAVKERNLKVLDYACGGGLVSSSLAPYASVLRGIDVSGEMVAQYNETARRLGLSPEQMRGVRGDLLGGDEAAGEAVAGPEFAGFDAAVISMALHHVADPASMLRALADRLAPGGSLVIIDWVMPDVLPDPALGGHPHHKYGHGHGHGHGHAHGDAHAHAHDHAVSHTITRPGFREEEMRSMLAEAGLLDYGYILHPERSKLGQFGEQQMFVARAKRAD